MGGYKFSSTAVFYFIYSYTDNIFLILMGNFRKLYNHVLKAAPQLKHATHALLESQ